MLLVLQGYQCDTMYTMSGVPPLATTAARRSKSRRAPKARSSGTDDVGADETTRCAASGRCVAVDAAGGGNVLLQRRPALQMLGDRAWLFLANLTLFRSMAWAAMLDRADRVTDPPYEFIIIHTTGLSA